MLTRPVQVRLEAADGSMVASEGMLQEYTTVDRLRRAAIILAAAVLLAAMLIPIPIVHLLGIPLMLITGLVVAGRQLGVAFRLKPMRLKCPRCGGVNRVGGGLGFRSIAMPRDRMCEECRRPLHVRIVDE